MSWNGYEKNVLLRNEGPGADGALRLTRVGLALGADAPRDARGMASFDYDGDGDLDIIINHNPGDTGDPEAARPTLLRNEVGAARNWLAVELEGRKSNRDGIGAVVQLEAGGLRQMRHASAGSAYASQSSGKLYFGLGAESKIDTLTVRWPAGDRRRVPRHRGPSSCPDRRGPGAQERYPAKLLIYRLARARSGRKLSEAPELSADSRWSAEAESDTPCAARNTATLGKRRRPRNH